MREYSCQLIYFIILFVDTPVLKYQGCWIDNPHNRILKDLYSNYRGGGIYWNNILETVLNCATDADKNSKDYNTFAIQYYGECWSEEGNPDYRQMRAAPHACPYGISLIILHSVF